MSAGRRCAVLGLGPIGLLFCHVLKQRGAARVTGVDRIGRSDVAADFGIDDEQWATSAQWAGKLGVERPDVVIEAVGHQVSTPQDAPAAVAPSGKIFSFGVKDNAVYPFKRALLLRKNLTLMSGVTLANPDAGRGGGLPGRPSRARRALGHRSLRPYRRPARLRDRRQAGTGPAQGRRYGERTVRGARSAVAGPET